MHDQAFQGLSIMIFGQQPLIPMRMEQTIASVAPSIEVGIESFEDYHQALSFARSSKRVGLLIATDTMTNLPLHDVIQNLTQPWSASTGLPGFSVIAAVGPKTITGYETMAKNRRVFDYIDARDILEAQSAASFVPKLWQSFVDHLEQDILSETNQEWLVTLAQEKGLSKDSIQFSQRLAHFFRGKANITWMESLVLPWFMLTDTLNDYSTRLGVRAGGLFSLASTLKIETIPSNESLLELTKSKLRTSSKIKGIIKTLDEWRGLGVLEERLEKEVQNSKPFHPALLRSIVKDHQRILEFSRESSQNIIVRKAG